MQIVRRVRGQLLCMFVVLRKDVTRFWMMQDLLKVSLSPEARGDPQMQRWSPGRDSFCQEPIFVPRPQSSAEDDGWILAPVFRSATSTTDLVILDAQELSKGPIATIHLPHHIPIGGMPVIASSLSFVCCWYKGAHSNSMPCWAPAPCYCAVAQSRRLMVLPHPCQAGRFGMQCQPLVLILCLAWWRLDHQRLYLQGCTEASHTHTWGLS